MPGIRLFLLIQFARAYSDIDPFPGTNYYRMRVENPSGSIQYSEVITLNRSDNGGLTVTFATNSSFSQLRVSLLSNNNNTFGVYGATIVNALGQQVLSEKFNVTTRTHFEDIQIANLQKGIYYIKIFGKDGAKLKAAAFMKM